MEKQEIINYILNTPENTNPAILGGMLEQLIAESEAGGGGESDFTTAEVTFNIMGDDVQSIPVMFFTCAEADELGEGAPATAYFGALPVTDGYKATVPLYKGKFVCLIGLLASNDYEIINTTGDISIAYGMMIITGDGEITIAGNK